MPAPLVLSSEIVAGAIQNAKTTDQDDFRRTELAWLGANNTLACIAIDGFFIDRGRRDYETADAGRQGILLGNYVLRNLAETDEFDYDMVRANQKNNLVGVQFAYPRELKRDDIGRLFGRAADAILTVRHPAARSLCAAYMGISLSREVPSQLDDFLAFPGERNRKDRVIRRNGRA
jgi:hypothetical protein